MTIIFVLENFYPKHRAGTETYVLNLARYFIQKNWNVYVFIAAVGKKSYSYTFESIQVQALSVPQNITTKELNGLANPSNLKEFKYKIDEIKPDIIHFHSFSRSFTHPHLKMAHQSGAKVFFTAHLGGIFCARGDLQLFGKSTCDAKIKTIRCSACYASQKHNKMMVFLGAMASLIISKTPLKYQFPSLNLIANKKQSMIYLKKYIHTNIAIAQWIKKAFEINHIQNTIYIPQAINTELFTTKIERVNSSLKKHIHLGFIGRMNPSKGLHLLLNALSDYPLKNKFKLDVVTIKDLSELEYYTKMKNRFLKAELGNWNENLSHQEINIQMDNWALLILPSTSNEVAPLVILEANAKGIPVLGSDYPAIAEMIDKGKYGATFKNKSTDDLVKQLDKIVQNPGILNQWAQKIPKVKSFKEIASLHEKLYL